MAFLRGFKGRNHVFELLSQLFEKAGLIRAKGRFYRLSNGVSMYLVNKLYPNLPGSFAAKVAEDIPVSAASTFFYCIDKDGIVVVIVVG